MKYTKWIGLLLFAVMASASASYAQSDIISQHFSDYMEQEDYQTVYITKRMFRLVAQVAEGADDKALQKAVEQVDGLRSLSADKDGTGLYQTFANRIPKSFEELMIVKEGKERTCFWVKENTKGDIQELIMLSCSKEKISLVSIYGIVDLKQIAKLAKNMEIGGLEKLGDIEE